MQDRALKTRQALVTAAAEQFDRRGYEGTSLARVSKSADVTMGALTFHFPSKCDLADVVEEEGRQATRALVAEAAAGEGPPLKRLSRLTMGLARLLEREVAVRATVRLSGERCTGCWSDIWLPEVRRLLQEARGQAQVREEAATDCVVDLVAFLLTGVEAHMRAQKHSQPPLKAVNRLETVWQLVLGAIAPAHAPDPAR